MINSLKAARAEVLSERNPQLLELIEQAELAARTRAATFDRGFIGDLLRQEDTFVVPAEDVFFRVFSTNDSAAARQIARLAAASPKQAQEMRNTLFAIFRASFTENGRPTSRLTRRFFDRHRAVVDAFFTPAERKEIHRLGGFGRVIERKQESLKRLEQAWQRPFRGKIANINSEEMVRKFFTETLTEADVRKMRNLLRSSGNEAVWGRFRDALGDEVRRQMQSTVRGRSFNERSLDTMLEQFGPKLSQAFGPQYTQNLRTLRNALEIARARPPQAGREGPGILSLMSRVLVAPPLTRAGRGQTMIQSMRSKAAERAMFEALSDPAKLNAPIKSRNAEATIRTGTQILGMLGASSLASSE